MKTSKYRIYATVTFSKYLGVVEAKGKGKALDKGFALDAYQQYSGNTCHECSRNLGDPSDNDLIVELIDDAGTK